MGSSELTPESAHPKARKLLTEDFYWSSIDESGPFGNDDGSDAFYEFKQWRAENRNNSLTIFLDQLFSEWNFPKFNLQELDTVKIIQYMSNKAEVNAAEKEEQMATLEEYSRKMAKEAGKEFDEEQFRKMVEATSSSMGGRYLLGLDNAIIAVGMGQFILEGKIDKEIKSLATIAIKRELLPMLIERWDGHYRGERKEKLNKMLIAFDRMEE